MTPLRAAPDRVGPTEGVVERIQERRERPRQKRPFPAVGEEEAPPEEDRTVPETPPELEDDDEEHTLDIHVGPLLPPTRQLLPAHGLASSAH